MGEAVRVRGGSGGPQLTIGGREGKKKLQSGRQSRLWAIFPTVGRGGWSTRLLFYSFLFLFSIPASWPANTGVPTQHNTFSPLPLSFLFFVGGYIDDKSQDQRLFIERAAIYPLLQSKLA